MTPIPLHAANPGTFTGQGNWTYLIPGAEPVLIDAGVGHPDHLAAIAAAAPNGPAHVVLTHAHTDHASGARHLAAKWRDIVFSKIPWLRRDADLGVTYRAIDDGSRIPTGEGELEVVHTPGHAPDHIVLWHAESRTLFGGDLMQLGATVMIPASHEGDLAAYLRSLQRVRDLNPARVLPAHGPVIEDPLALIDYYLTHRQQREQQILDALSAGADTLDALVSRIYVGLDPNLVPLARESVLAHLVKLEQDGKAAHAGGQWLLLP